MSDQCLEGGGKGGFKFDKYERPLEPLASTSRGACDNVRRSEGEGTRQSGKCALEEMERVHPNRTGRCIEGKKDEQ